MTAPRFADIILSNCQPLTAEPTKVEPKLGALDGIRAVLFDIYGTLLISASGDIGANTGDHRLEALQETVQQFQLDLKCRPAAAVRCLEAQIANAHSVAKAQGVEFPEVDIVDIWQTVAPQIVVPPIDDGDLSGVDWHRFALEYEVRVNPVWPMPGVEWTLSRLAASALVVGIVSNAQFFTPLLFPALLGKTVEQLGFARELSYFSYEHRQAKPGSYLYRLARQQLAGQGIEPAEVLFVGNDMLNDIGPAAASGYRTALFAGDRRSLRLRSGDARVQGVVPDRIITELSQLIECLVTSS